MRIWTVSWCTIKKFDISSANIRGFFWKGRYGCTVTQFLNKRGRAEAKLPMWTEPKQSQCLFLLCLHSGVELPCTVGSLWGFASSLWLHIYLASIGSPPEEPPHRLGRNVDSFHCKPWPRKNWEDVIALVPSIIVRIHSPKDFLYFVQNFRYWEKLELSCMLQ